jgi:hypothetical protein
MDREERAFAVTIQIFTSIFAVGLGLVFQHNLVWGFFFIVSGFLGLVILRKPKLPSFHRGMFVPVLASVTLSILIALVVSQIFAIRNDFNTFVVPRTVTAKQAEQLRVYLSSHDRPHAVTVKVNPFDPEALQYAEQIFNALQAASWRVSFDSESPNNKSPNGLHTLNIGLCLAETGEKAGVPGPEHNPVMLLREAFQSAHIEIRCTLGSADGEYGAYVLVGHRPLTVKDEDSVFSKMKHWIESIRQSMKLSEEKTSSLSRQAIF